MSPRRTFCASHYANARRAGARGTAANGNYSGNYTSLVSVPRPSTARAVRPSIDGDRRFLQLRFRSVRWQALSTRRLRGRAPFRDMSPHGPFVAVFLLRNAANGRTAAPRMTNAAEPRQQAFSSARQSARPAKKIADSR